VATRGDKEFDYMIYIFSRFDTILACDEQADGETDRQADILRQRSPRCAYA